MAKKVPKGPWTFRVRKRKNYGEHFCLCFKADGSQGVAGDEMLSSRWYPPWQNELMRQNAETIVHDLNAAFHARADNK